MWLRYYLDFCDKYPMTEANADRARLFCEKLRDKQHFLDGTPCFIAILRGEIEAAQGRCGMGQLSRKRDERFT